jgi:hypothetical protein
MVTAKDCYALTSYYEKLYKARYGKAPIVNKFKARYGFDAILQGLKKDEQAAVYGLLDYYFKTSSTNGHALSWFFNNYDRLEETKQLQYEDEQQKIRLRAESEERARKWKERREHQGNSDD